MRRLVTSRAGQSSTALRVRSLSRAAVVVVAALASLMLASASPDAAMATTVSGIIATDTEWVKSESPYIIDGKVQIAFGAQLTIAPGVAVRGGTLETFGRLYAEGADRDWVHFDGVKIAPGTNVSTEPFEINLSFCLIDGCHIFEPTGYAIYGSLSIRDSAVTGTGWMYLWYPRGDCFFERNVLRESGRITTLNDGYGTVYIRHNLFFKSGWLVENRASYGGVRTIIEGNTFTVPDDLLSRLVLRLPPGYSDAALDARGNYWDSMNADTVAALIYDKADDLACAGYIPIDPWLTAAAPETPGVDLTPPTIVMHGLVDGEWYSIDTVPVPSASDPDLARLESLLDGQLWTQGDMVSEGHHTLWANAWDTSSNQASESISFGVDRTPPVTSLDTPTIAPALLLLNALDEEGGSGVAATYFRLDEGPVTSGTVVPVGTTGIHKIEY